MATVVRCTGKVFSKDGSESVTCLHPLATLIGSEFWLLVPVRISARGGATMVCPHGHCAPLRQPDQIASGAVGQQAKTAAGER